MLVFAMNTRVFAYSAAAQSHSKGVGEHTTLKSISTNPSANPDEVKTAESCGSHWMVAEVIPSRNSSFDEQNDGRLMNVRF